MEKLQEKKQGPVMKRPAAAPKQVAGSKAKGLAAGADGMGKTAAKAVLKLGCKKCSKNPKGCDQCRRASYSGLRLTRAEWLAGSKKYGWK